MVILKCFLSKVTTNVCGHAKQQREITTEMTTAEAGKMRADVEPSNLKCQKALPKSKAYRVADRGGLALLIKPEGGKLWRWRYRFDGKMKQMGLGKYPDVSLADARLRHGGVDRWSLA